MKLAEMTWPQVTALSPDVPIVIPTAALEQHGHHLPLFTDSMLVGEVTRRAEAALADKIVLTPVMWLGNSAHHLDFAGTPALTLGLLAALRRRGMAMGSFKIGPDYIDPAFHAIATGRPTYNIDPWAMRFETLAGLLEESGEGCDLVLGEGVMGLFDGAADGTGATADISALRAVPRVRSVTITNRVPYGGSSWNTGVTMAPDQKRNSLSASMYLASEDFLATTGLRLAEGRDFLPGEYLDFSANVTGVGDPGVVLLNRPMASKLFPDGSALGGTISVTSELGVGSRFVVRLPDALPD